MVDVRGRALSKEHEVRTPNPLARRNSGPAWHRVAEWMIRLLAVSAIGAIILIFLFVGKETLPLLFSSSVREEVTLAKMWIAQHWAGYDAAEHVWQPVSDIPK